MSDKFGMPIVDCRTVEERLREQVAAQAAVIESLRNCLKEIRGLSYATTWETINEALAIPTDSTQILDEVRKKERERVAKVCDSVAAKRWPNDIGPEAEECAAAIRAME